jgi:histidine triad (HIT) family protein
VNDCVFCAIAVGEKTDQPIVAADEHTVAFLDTRPVFKGHVLVIPRLHYRTLANLPPELTGPLFTRVRQVSAAMAAASGTDGSFIGVNNTVTQSVPHLHVHVVPHTHRDGLRRTAAMLAYACGHLFWPHARYADQAEQASYARRLSRALPGIHSPGQPQS